MPVPDYFILTSNVFRSYQDNNDFIPEHVWKGILEDIAQLELMTGKQFGGERYSLLLSVRSSPIVSMPGLMDTIMNIGMNKKTINGLIEYAGEKDGAYFAYDTYRRFIESYVQDVSARYPKSDTRSS